MNCFFDTSALIKKYVAERGSDVVKSYLNQSKIVYVSSTARIECFSVISRMIANNDIELKPKTKT